MIKTSVLTISDKCFSGEREDKSGKLIINKMESLPSEIIRYEIVPDEIDPIKDHLIYFADKLSSDVILTTGGTGFSKRDVTPEATKDVIEKEILGIPEAMRIEGLKKTKNAILSRSVAGIRGNCLIINLPGSTKGVEESLDIIMPIIIHSHNMILGKGH
jgi:molybdenum cofactor synthesis domain-containing protein